MVAEHPSVVGYMYDLEQHREGRLYRLNATVSLLNLIEFRSLPNMFLAI